MMLFVLMAALVMFGVPAYHHGKTMYAGFKYGPPPSETLEAWGYLHFFVNVTSYKVVACRNVCEYYEQLSEWADFVSKALRQVKSAAEVGNEDEDCEHPLGEGKLCSGGQKKFLDSLTSHTQLSANAVRVANEDYALGTLVSQIETGEHSVHVIQKELNKCRKGQSVSSCSESQRKHAIEKFACAYTVLRNIPNGDCVLAPENPYLGLVLEEFANKTGNARHEKCLAMYQDLVPVLKRLVTCSAEGECTNWTERSIISHPNPDADCNRRVYEMHNQKKAQ